MNKEEILKDWALSEFAPWMRSDLSEERYRSELIRLNAQIAFIAIFVVSDGKVTVMPKPPALVSPEYEVRIGLYMDLFRSAATDLDLVGKTITVPVCLADHSFESAAIPIFSFQKPTGSNNILLPDVDFMGWNFYENEDQRDHRQYEDKKNLAVFAGATTGAIIRHKDVDLMSVPRLRAADYFRSSELVRFQLTEIVQCESEEVAQRLRKMGYGSGRISWSEQLESKFLISMDGNGATCSRVVMALRSNSVLLKYDSDSLLYYFKGLKPWIHYIPVEKDEDIERIVEIEIKSPGHCLQICKAGQEFAGEYLDRKAVARYTAVLLHCYADVVAQFEH